MKKETQCGFEMQTESPSWLPWNSTHQRTWGATCRLPHFTSPPLALSFLISLGLFCCFTRVYEPSGPRFLTCTAVSTTTSLCSDLILLQGQDLLDYIRFPTVFSENTAFGYYIYQSRQLSVCLSNIPLHWVLSSRRSETL